ncbi:MAG TPA: hypothetical protein VIE69_04795 [Methylophilaceae bacterium]
MNKTAFLFAMLFIFTAQSYAETVNATGELANNSKTMSYITGSQTSFNAVRQLGIAQDHKLGLQLDCKTEYKVKPVSAAVLAPINFPDSQQNPVSGVWSLRYELQRCGESKIYNAIFVANADGSAPTPHPFYPGTSYSSPILIKDAMRSALPSAMIKSGDRQCKDLDMLDMRVTQEPHDVIEGDKTSKGVWNETWTFLLCGKPVDTDITFVPDATGGGTSFFINMGKVGEKKP